MSLPSFLWLWRKRDCVQCCYCWWSMQDDKLDGSQAKAAKAFSDYIKQETTKLESGTVTKPKYLETDEEEEVEASAVKLAHSCMGTCTSSPKSAVLSSVHHTFPEYASSASRTLFAAEAVCSQEPPFAATGLALDADIAVLLQGDGTDSTGDGGAGMGGGADGPPLRTRKSRHYDAKDDVILRMEALQPKEVKVRTYCISTAGAQQCHVLGQLA